MGRCLHGHEPMHAQTFEVPLSAYEYEHEALAVALHRAADFISGGVREDGVNFYVNAITTVIESDQAIATVIYNVFGEPHPEVTPRDIANGMRLAADRIEWRSQL